MRVIHEYTRGCGRREEGGVYLVSELSPLGTLPPWVAIEPPILYGGEHFRGYIYVNGDQLLAGDEEGTWLIGPSLDRLIGEEWKLTLGMPLKIRQKFGICAGLKTVEDVTEKLADLGLYSDKMYPEIATDIHRALEYLKQLDTPAEGAASQLKMAQRLGLSGAQILARCWLIARQLLWDLPLRDPHNDIRVELRKDLARVMVLVGALEDARDLLTGRWREVWKGSN